MSDNSIIEKLLLQRQEQEKQKEVIIDRIEDYKEALNRFFDSSDGKFLAKYWFKYWGIFLDEPLNNPVKLIEDKGRKSFYLNMVRPFLEKQVKMEIENQ